MDRFKAKDFINTRLWWCTGFSCSTHSLGLGLVGRGGALTAEGDGGEAAVSFTLEGECRLSSGGLFKAWPFCRGLSGTLSWGSLSAETWTGSAGDAGPDVQLIDLEGLSTRRRFGWDFQQTNLSWWRRWRREWLVVLKHTVIPRYAIAGQLFSN